MPLDPQAKALLDALGITTQPGVETLSPQAARDRYKTLSEARRALGSEAVHRVQDLAIPGPAGEIPIRLYTPDIAQPASVLIYFHGGGWVIGNIESHDHVCRSLANKAQCIVASVDYRLSPESKFPAAVDDCYAAVEWIAAHGESLGIDSSRIAVGGDSAGGNLSAVIAQLARDRKGPGLVLQLLIYPGTDMRMQAPSIDANADGPLLTKAAIVWFMSHYLRNERDKLDPLASPLLAANLGDLPPAFILTAECDPLCDEGEAYADKLKSAGVRVDVKRYAGMPHGFFSFGTALEACVEAHQDSAAHLRDAFRLGIRHADSAA